ncbi:hypothetical protein BHM03_00044455 [Ensete ventricosum]|nr:hypothetical protein BHM03_00044455 [Ensete ventricosum]
MRPCKVGCVAQRPKELQSVFSSTKENTEVLKQVVERGEKATMSLEGLSYPKAKRRLEMRWTRRSATIPQRWTYRARRKGHRCKATDSRAMAGQCHVVKGVEEVENAEANSKYQDKVKGQRPKNFIIPVSTGFKIVESEGLRVDAEVLDQGTK